MKTLTIKVPAGVSEWLKTTARRRRQTEAEVASQALADAIGKRQPSLADLVADLAGIGQGRHRDLSTNKKHLAGFGR